jgi:leucyl aminopeptidase
MATSPQVPALTLRRGETDALLPETPLFVVAVCQDEPSPSGLAAQVDQALDGALRRVRDVGDFKGREEDQALFYRGGDDGPRRVLFLGLGLRAEADAESLRKFAGRAVRRAEALGVSSLHLSVPVLGGAGGAAGSLQAAAEGLGLAAWDFRELRSTVGRKEPLPPLVSEASLSLNPSVAETSGAAISPAEEEAAIRRGAARAEGANFARTLQNRPGNIATPVHLAEAAAELAREHGLGLTLLGPEEMRAERMGALLSVAQGSEEEPRLIVLEYRGGRGGEAPLALVGKGLTFDTGGISIKPAQGMEEMKFDMSGGAAVLGALKAIALLELPVNVVGVVPASENHISGRATRPGDVVWTRAGKSVEIINTDAEGRLILADALSYTVDRFRPAAMVDCATLTGACVIALGNQAAAVFGRDDSLVQELRDAGDRSGERCWPLPLWPAYRKQLDSPVADLKNVGGREAGSVTAALFLAEFVDPEIPWAHLDIAGTAYGDPRAPYFRKGGFGLPTRLFVEWVCRRAEGQGDRGA